jgi:hypothetical protein
VRNGLTWRQRRPVATKERLFFSLNTCRPGQDQEAAQENAEHQSDDNDPKHRLFLSPVGDVGVVPDPYQPGQDLEATHLLPILLARHREEYDDEYDYEPDND